MIKLPFTLVAVALLFIAPAMPEEARAQDQYQMWQNQRDAHQRQMEQEHQRTMQQQQIQQQQEMYRQQQSGAARPSASQSPPPPPPPLHSRYGAVAWSDTTGAMGSAAKMASQVEGINLALQRCGEPDCKIAVTAANQCMAVAYGWDDKGGRSAYADVDDSPSKLEKRIMSACKEKSNECELFLSQCSYKTVDPASRDRERYWKEWKSLPFKASSYGAIVWGKNSSAYGVSSKQDSAQAAVDLAFKSCGKDCVLAQTYGDQCAVLTAGVKPNGADHFQITVKKTQKQAESEGLAGCSTHAKSCKIVSSECSIADGVSGRTTQAQ